MWESLPQVAAPPTVLPLLPLTAIPDCCSLRPGHCSTCTADPSDDLAQHCSILCLSPGGGGSVPRAGVLARVWPRWERCFGPCGDRWARQALDLDPGAGTLALVLPSQPGPSVHLSVTLGFPLYVNLEAFHGLDQVLSLPALATPRASPSSTEGDRLTPPRSGPQAVRTF